MAFLDMLKRRRPTPLVFSAICLLFVSGCGESAVDRYNGPLGDVSGRVTIGGKPIPEGCIVMFQAKSGSYSATGKIDSLGEYTLMYQGSHRLPAVSYAVQIAPPVDERIKPIDPGQMPSADPKLSIHLPRPPFPVRYYSTTSSKLDFTVDEGTNQADFQLVE